MKTRPPSLLCTRCTRLATPRRDPARSGRKRLALGRVAKPESPPSLLLDAVRSGEIEMVACDKLLSEVRGGLAGRYFRDRITDDERIVIPEMLEALALIVPDPVSPPTILRDPSDDYLVALAQTARAEAIVTGDNDLLDHQGLDPPALSAREACRRLGLIAS